MLKKKEKLINFSAGGFKDFTSIGSSDPKMWVDIFCIIKNTILKTFDNFFKDINKLKN